MAGHSKWANIQHRKGRQDAARAKLFSRLSKEISIAVKMGGADPDMNPRLRLAIANAKGQSMPKDNIERAINKGAGGDGADYEEIRYEGFGPGGIGLIVEVSTDNRNRAASEVRAAFSKNGGNLGETGSVAFMFDQVGEIRYSAEKLDEARMMDAALEAGAEDVGFEEGDADEGEAGEHVVYTAREDFAEVQTTLEGLLGVPVSAKLIWRAQTAIEVEADKAPVLMKLLGALDECDDVQNVYANYEMTEAAMESVG
jgi:YebC/PmpR family DNA-binding regulatory protein